MKKNEFCAGFQFSKLLTQAEVLRLKGQNNERAIRKSDLFFDKHDNSISFTLGNIAGEFAAIPQLFWHQMTRNKAAIAAQKSTGDVDSDIE